jgi:hypothetical protein
MGGLMARFMVDYYTPERIQDLLVRCLDEPAENAALARRFGG